MKPSDEIEASEKLYIRNMVCDRCIMVVAQELTKLGLNTTSVTLGEVAFAVRPSEKQIAQVRESLSAVGFELIDDRRSLLIEQAKNAMIEIIHRKTKLKTNLSDYLAREIGRDYSYISNLFSEVEGITIEQYFIHQKIEKVKELLVYGELTLSQIAFELGYSSVGHLSNQFKKVTGLTPSHFKQVRENKRTPINRIGANE